MSAAIHLDFLQATPPRSRRVGVLFGLALLALAGCIGSAVHTAHEAARLDEAMARLRRETERVAPARQDVVSVDKQHLAEDVKQANEVIERLSTPWPRLFSGLEAAATPSVVLVGLQPEEQGRRLRIAGVAQRYDDVLDYLGRLQDVRGFSDVFLANHETRDESGGSTISFSVTAQWEASAR